MPDRYICACKHPRFCHAQGALRCYGGGQGAAWCKCKTYDGPIPCKTCKGPHVPTAAHKEARL